MCFLSEQLFLLLHPGNRLHAIVDGSRCAVLLLCYYCSGLCWLKMGCFLSEECRWSDTAGSAKQPWHVAASGAHPAELPEPQHRVLCPSSKLLLQNVLILVVYKVVLNWMKVDRCRGCSGSSIRPCMFCIQYSQHSPLITLYCGSPIILGNGAANIFLVELVTGFKRLKCPVASYPTGPSLFVFPYLFRSRPVLSLPNMYVLHQGNIISCFV